MCPADTRSLQVLLHDCLIKPTQNNSKQKTPSDQCQTLTAVCLCVCVCAVDRVTPSSVDVYHSRSYLMREKHILVCVATAQVVYSYWQCSVYTSLLLSVSPLNCGKMADWLWMLFGLVGQVGPRMCSVDGAGDLPHRNLQFWGRIWGSPL